MSSKSTYDVVIAGGGMVGLSLAIPLAQSGLSVAVIDPVPFDRQQLPAFDGRVSAIALSSKYMLENIGVWSALVANAEPILDIRVSDGHVPFFLHYYHEEVSEEPFGWIAENRHIRKALSDVAASLNTLMLLEGDAVLQYEASANNVLLTLKSGAEIYAKLLIGADGKRSHIRELAEIDTVTSDYRQTAIVCTISHEKSHHGLAQERFLPPGPFAVLPMQENRSSLVWVEPQDRVQLYLDLPKEECEQEITERVGSYLGKITLEGDRFAYPLSYQLAKTYVSERVALIGDAAHAIHPIAGQGVNLGFRDAAVLAGLITRRAKLGMEFADADTLNHYQRWRRLDNFAMLAVTDGLSRLFSTRNPLIAIARGLGLSAVGTVPPLKRLFMRHAMGLTGDIAPLMKKQHMEMEDEC